MQSKIQKIFSYFGNIKNQPFYTSCISQIIEIYQSNPQSLKFILYNLNQLIFSSCKEVRLRLKHRLITASLISKLNKIYVQRVKQFLEDKLNFQLQSFQLDSQPDKIQEKDKAPLPKWQEIDLLKVIQTEDLLHSSSKGKGDSMMNDNVEDEKKVFDSFLDMNHATMLNIQNAFKDVQTQNEVTDEAIRSQKQKFKIKVQKINSKSKEQIESVEFTISNPFNLMYEICISNMLNTQWQLRHLSVLILRQLLLHSQFLGFCHKFSMTKLDGASNRFQFLSNTTKDLLRKHVADAIKKKHLFDEVITKTLFLLSLDRFADYQTDESVILVRMVGGEILTICFRVIQSAKQTQLIKMIRRVFEKQSPFNNNKSKFTWQVKHSFLHFLTILLQHDRSHGKLLCAQLEQCLIKMLANDQVDEITLCICQVIESFIGQPFFTPDKIDRTNRQIWNIVQTLDDISISAKDTLKLLYKLFPYFKLNEGACIDRLKKFFTSKISQVRGELYRLISCLYSKKKDISDTKIIERSLVQLLQAGLIQYETDNFNQVVLAMPQIMPYIVKAKNIRKIVEFINTCVTPNQYTEQIIINKFLMGQDKQKSEYTSNEYLYIYQHENVHCPISAYTDKRIWKMALLLRSFFSNSSEGLQELIKGVEKNNEKNHRAKILIYLVLTHLMPQYRKLKIFDDYKEQATKLIMLQFSQILDNQITKFYMPELDKQLKNILEQGKFANEKKSNDALVAIRQIWETFKKNQYNLKSATEIAKKLSVLYSQQLDPILLGDIEIILRIMNNIMKIQRQLAKNVKIFAVLYLVQYNAPNEVQNLNVVIKAIMDAIKEDSYAFISEATAKAVMGLSLSLIKTKKVVYNKFNSNLCNFVSTSYIPSELKLGEHADSIQLEGKYMGGICKYIELIGSASPDYLKDTWKFYLLQNMQKKEGKPTELTEEYNRLLTLLSGTSCTLLKIDRVPLDEQEYFINKFTRKISLILKNSTQTALADSIKIKIKKILSDTLVFLSDNYTEISNVFFEWYLHELAQQNTLFYEVLEKISSDYIVKLASVSSLFIMQIIKSITNEKLRDISMNSLSNLIVGVYTNIAKVNFSPTLWKISEEGIEFIKNFKNTSNFKYQLTVSLAKDIDLRSYQIEGITWMGFLTKYNLSGALCDDMGLGKTLQTLMVLENEYNNTLHNSHEQGYFHSLIVCPTTLMEHWAFQYKKYFPRPLCEVMILDNKKKVSDVSKKESSKQPVLFITSYSMMEKQDNLFEKYSFKFIILDQGHIIKNTRTNKFKAVRKLKGLHRFILTGTPIQNRLIELWGLFDFLMPGYLYTEEIFKKYYQKLFEVNLTTFHEDQLLFSEGQRKTLQKLHFKVMPFIMRRMKGDVLRELPQKIINDYYCCLSQSQIRHYEQLQIKIKEQANNKELNVLGNLHEMIKIVNHPFLADLQPKCVWQDSGKFVALGELFQQFGFTDDDSIQHNKVIIFAKQKNTIDLIQRFLKQCYKHINYLKLTADIKIGERFTVAQTFNGDSDIKVLIVTKAIGGEGLNLSSANCVIMFDSDYNPTVDMQAIDRAHRIGQKRVLNVYRLITKDTLEEKIMGIQKFKTNLANAIVNIDNASIKNIQESRLPELLQNVRDLQQNSKQSETKINNSMYGAIVAEMEKNAIQTKQFLQRY